MARKQNLQSVITAPLSLYGPGYIDSLIYLLQTSDYKYQTYLKKYWQTQNFFVTNSKELKRSNRNKSLAKVLWSSVVFELLIGIYMIYAGHWQNLPGGIAFGAAIIVATPIVLAHEVALLAWMEDQNKAQSSNPVRK